MTALLAVAGGLCVLIVIGVMLLLVPRGTERLRRRRTPAERQGAELAPEEESS